MFINICHQHHVVCPDQIPLQTADNVSGSLHIYMKFVKLGHPAIVYRSAINKTAPQPIRDAFAVTIFAETRLPTEPLSGIHRGLNTGEEPSRILLIFSPARAIPSRTTPREVHRLRSVILQISSQTTRFELSESS